MYRIAFIVLHCVVLHCIVCYCITLYCIVLYRVVMQCILSCRILLQQQPVLNLSFTDPSKSTNGYLEPVEASVVYIQSDEPTCQAREPIVARRAAGGGKGGGGRGGRWGYACIREVTSGTRVNQHKRVFTPECVCVCVCVWPGGRGVCMHNIGHICHI